MSVATDQYWPVITPDLGRLIMYFLGVETDMALPYCAAGLSPPFAVLNIEVATPQPQEGCRIMPRHCR
jgi:hypothetical protein